MARMMSLTPAPKVSIGDSREILATQCGRYASGLRGTVQFWDNGAPKFSECLNLDDSAEREDFAIVISAESGVDPKIIKDALLTLIGAVEDSLRQQDPPLRSPDTAEVEYRTTPHGIMWMKRTKDGEIPTPLTNFSAEIVADAFVDDGAETWRTFTLQATLDGHTVVFDVPALKFASMQWPMEHLGAKALLYPGQTLREHARAAIQILSEGVRARHIYAHTGWRCHDGGWHYLHAGGALGQDGQVADLEVVLPEELNRYALQPPADQAALVRAVQASMKILELAPLSLALPAYAAVWLPVLGPASMSLFLAGQTGIGKTALAALLQQHYGAAMDAEHLPANWSSSANALEALAFAAKDALMVVDEFTPTDALQGQTLYRTAERLFRAQANHSGRQRMRRDTSLRPAKPPRGLLLATGEDIPQGHSLRARLVILEVPPDAVQFNRLGACQADAAAGMYVQALAGFVQWLAPQYAQIQQQLPEELTDLRQQAVASGLHRRTPENVARLAVAWRYFLDFAEAIGALGHEDAQAWWARGWQVLGEVARAQATYLDHAEPTQRFLDLLSEAIARGKAHIASPDGNAPATPQAWGWRSRDCTWSAQGDRVGWLDRQVVYLLPDASYAVAQALGRDVGEPLTVSPYTLRRRLKERGLLAVQEASRETVLVRKMLEGKRTSVLPVILSALTVSPLVEISDQPDHTPDAPPPGQVSPAMWSGHGQAFHGAPDHRNESQINEVRARGQVGQEKGGEDSVQRAPVDNAGQVTEGQTENLTTQPDQLSDHGGREEVF